MLEYGGIPCVHVILRKGRVQFQIERAGVLSVDEYCKSLKYSGTVTWGQAVVFAGYSGFLHYLQLASHELAIIGKNVTKNKKIQIPSIAGTIR